MKDKFSTQLAVACCLTMITVASASSTLLDCQPLEWYVEIYSSNHDYIKVIIDARKMPKNQYLQSISFQVNFHDDQNRYISTEIIDFANEPTRGLDPAFYEIYLKHSYSAASSAKGGDMKFNCKTRGLAFVRPPSRVPAKENGWEEYPKVNEITVIGTPHNAQSGKAQSASDYTGFWHNTNAKLHYIQFIEIVALDPNRLRIRAWLRCNPTPGEGGTIRNCLSWGPDVVNTTSFDEVIWRHDEVQVRGGRRQTVTFKHILSIDDGTLNVSVDKFGNGYNSFRRGKRLR
jgi:hypothetical protein